jgi:hypothetical protein
MPLRYDLYIASHVLYLFGCGDGEVGACTMLNDIGFYLHANVDAY